MILGVLKDAVGWLVSVAEVAAVIAAVLLIGLIIGMTGFRILSYFVGKLGGSPPELDSYPYEDEPLDANPPPSKP